MLIKTRNQNKIVQQKNDNEKIEKNKQLNNNKLKNNKKSINQNQTDAQNNMIVQKNKYNKAYQTPLIKPKLSFKLKQSKLYQVTQIFQDQIIIYLKNLQQKYRINEDYIKFHKKLTMKFRNFLIQYMFKVCLKFKCNRKTIFLAVYFFDYYLSKNLSIDSQQHIVTIAQASLHMALKYQQIYPPSLKQWTSYKHYSTIITQQSQIIKQLDFKFNLPSIYYFQQYFLSRSQKVNQIIKYQPNLENDMKVKLISDICLFDTTLYAYTGYDLALNVIRLVNNVKAPFKEERIVLNIKWAIERNPTMVEWLKANAYKQLRDS